MRIITVIDSLAYGGAEHSLVSLVPALVASGAELSIVGLFQRETDLTERARRSGAEVVFAPEGSVMLQAKWLRRLLRSRAPDVLHTTLARSDLVGRAASVGLPAPVVTSLVSVKNDELRSRTSGVHPWKLHAARIVDQSTGRLWTDHFHVVSEAVLKNAHQRLGIARERMTVIPRGRDPDTFYPADEDARRSARADLGVPVGHDLLLHVGRHEPAKGLVHLIDAFAEVRRQRPDSALVLVGAPGATTPAVRARILERDLGASVRLLGRRSDVPRLLGAADVFVLPSLWEGLPNAVIEAMATATPVVASDIESVRNAVEPGRTALLAASGDPQDLSKQLLRLLVDSDLRRRLGNRGREVFLQRYTTETVAAQMLRLYENVAAGPNPRTHANHESAATG